MSLIALVGDVFANSYPTVEEADLYFSDRTHAEIWDDVESKPALLVTCSRMLDWYGKWKGFKTDNAQGMDWPRADAIREDGAIIPSDELPPELKIAVFERHHDKGFHSIGFIKGIGIKSGAIASTVAHDSHNLIVIGTDNESMMKIANFMKIKGGGMAAYTKNKTVYFPLPIAGLMSTDPIEKIVENYSAVKEAAQEMGSSNENVFMTMSFMALPVIPHLKITDMGLIDVDNFQPIDLIIQN